jgi:hypothetical protein
MVASPSPTTEAETYLVKCAASGQLAAFKSSQRGNVLSAEFLRLLILACTTDRAVAPLGFSISGAKIQGNLMLGNLGTRDHPLPTLSLSECVVEGVVDLSESCWASIVLENVSLGTLVAPRVHLGNGLRLRNLRFTSPERVEVNLQHLRAGADVDLRGIGREAGEDGGLFPCSLDLSQCHLSGSLLLDGAALSDIDRKALSLAKGVILGDVQMNSDEELEFCARGEIELTGAKIGGCLAMNGAQIVAPGRTALRLVDSDIGNGIWLSSSGKRRFKSQGMLCFKGIRVRGSLSLDGALLENALADVALEMERAEVSGSLFLRASQDAPFEAQGSARILGARIGGSISCTGALMQANSDWALTLQGATVGRNVSFGGRNEHVFLATGGLDFRSARIEGTLHFDGGQVSSTATALSLRNARVEGDVLLTADKGLPARFLGKINAAGAHIRGTFRGTGMQVEVTKGLALSLVGADIGGSVSFASGKKLRSEVKGEIALYYARIGGSLELDGAKLSNERGLCLAADGMTVARDVFLRGDGTFLFEAFGAVQLIGARIGGDLDLTKACFIYTTTPPDDHFALDLSRTSIGDALVVKLDRKRASGHFVLTGTNARELRDNGGSGWGPMPELDSNKRLTGVLLNLDGFVYDRVARAERSPKSTAMDRIRWLDRQYVGSHPTRRDYSPQPHEQLARALRLSGHDEEARRVSVHKFDYQRQCGVNGMLLRSVMFLFGLCFGYGYSPTRALVTLVLWILLGSWGVSQAMQPPAPALVKASTGVEIVRSLATPDTPIKSPTFNPASDVKDHDSVRYAQHPAVSVRDVPCPGISSFGISSFLFALDTILPVVGLHMVEKCEVSDDAPGWKLLRAAYSIVGWVIVALAALTWTGILRRDT